MISFRNLVLDKLGVDNVILWTLLSRGWSAASGVITIILIANFFTLEQQGYFYSLSSLIALNMFFELSINLATIQFASHEKASLEWSRTGVLVGSPQAKGRLQSLIRFSVTWFAFAGVLMIVILVPAGIAFFGDTTSVEGGGKDLNYAWSSLVVITAINMMCNNFLAVIEGCGRRYEVSLLRFWQGFLSVIATWVVLTVGGGFYALPVGALMILGMGVFFLARNYNSFFLDLYRFPKTQGSIDWLEELWPFQWKMALSTVSYFLIMNCLTPIILRIEGAEAAGKFGMTLQIVASINSFFITWISTKAPVYGNLVASRRRDQLDNLFFSGLVQSSICLLLVLGGLFLAVFQAAEKDMAFVNRILPLSFLVFLFIACMANHIFNAQAWYLRAHKDEPFMALLVTYGIFTALAGYFSVLCLGLQGAVLSYSFCAICFGLIGGTVIFVRKRNEYLSLFFHEDKVS